MNSSGKFYYPPLGISSRNANPTRDSDLQPAKPFHRRKPKTPRTRLRKYGGSGGGKRSRPETPLLKWKIHEKNDDVVDVDEGEKPLLGRVSRRTCRDVKKQTELGSSVRRIAAGLWRLHQPEMVVGDSQRRLGFQVK